MLAYAFKNSELASQMGPWLGRQFSKAVAWKTGGKFSHVELWLGGPSDKALCFSSREGSGCGFQTIDLTAPAGLWVIEPLASLTAQQEDKIYGFAMAMSAAKVRYDYLGILGIATGHGEHNDHDRFCSEVCLEALQSCAGSWHGVKKWQVNPTQLYAMTQA
jgi:hypothetical protein